MFVHLTAAVHPGVLDATGRYIHWGVIQISLTNLLIIVGMAVLFVAALIVPFPGGRQDKEEHVDDHD